MRTTRIVAVSVAAVAAAGCAALAPTPDYDALTKQLVERSFRSEGIATVDRLQQDASNAECSKSLGQPLPEAKADAIMKAALASVKQPSDGVYVGDWQAGERLAQSGRGMTWSDPSAATSRGKKSESVQSSTTRTFLFSVGSCRRWYVRATNHAGNPRRRTPMTTATPLYRPSEQTPPMFAYTNGCSGSPTRRASMLAATRFP